MTPLCFLFAIGMRRGPWNLIYVNARWLQARASLDQKSLRHHHSRPREGRAFPAPQLRFIRRRKARRAGALSPVIPVHHFCDVTLSLWPA